jgi:hypothetical protein
MKHIFFSAEAEYIRPGQLSESDSEYGAEILVPLPKEKKKRPPLTRRYILAYQHNNWRRFPRNPTEREPKRYFDELNEAVQEGMCASCPFFVYDKRYKQVCLISW